MVFDNEKIFPLNEKSPEELSIKEKATLKDDLIEDIKPVSYISLFRYSTLWERFLTLTGTVLGCSTGVLWPLAIILYGEFTQLLIDRKVGGKEIIHTVLLPPFGGGRSLPINASYAERIAEIRNDANAYGACSLVVIFSLLVAAYLSVFILNYSAQRQTKRLRKKFFESVLRQDMGWYDTQNSATFASKITQNLDKIQDGIGERITVTMYFLTTIVAATIMSFITGWKLSLVVYCCSPILIISSAVVARVQSTLCMHELNSLNVAGGVVEEVISSIRTVIAFDGQQKEVKRYKENLTPARKMGIKRGLFTGLAGGLTWLIIYMSYAVAVWYGIDLILDDQNLPEDQVEYRPTSLVIILFGFIIGAMNLGLASPHLEAFSMARGAAASVYSIIKRKSAIDPLSDKGIKLNVLKGNLIFKNVHFEYPNRPEVKVLKGLNLEICSGETVALVGSSGCGKSTSIQLIQRLYDPTKGSVLLDGHDLRTLHVGWLRGQMGIVGQEPSLFDASISDNIRLGNMEATDAEIMMACRKANAHEFIMALPKGYETIVGERGSQISGGQKQRIAIARALIREPKLLLLDEATSALDTQSEAEVQAALDKASEGRTTIIVAHRLSTVAKADRIVVLNQGIVVESGTPQELLAIPNGIYHSMATANKNEKCDRIENDYSENNLLEKSENILSRRKKSSIRSNDQIIEEKNVEDPDNNYHVSFARLLKLNKPELPHLVVGFIAAITVGVTFSLFAIIFGELYNSFSFQSQEELRNYSYFLAGMFLLLGFLSGVGTFLQTFLFGLIGLRLTTRLRVKVFQAMLNQEAGWYDQPYHGVGKLCARLTADVANIQGATGAQVAIIFQSFVTICVGIGLAFYFSWKLTLASIVFIPLVFIGVYLDAKIVQGQGLDEKLAIQSATKIAVEAISNIRTVSSLGAERIFLEKYEKELNIALKASQKRSYFRGLIFGIGQTMPPLAYTFCLFYGGYLIADDEMPYADVIKVSESLIFGAWSLGLSLVFTPNFGEAQAAAGRLFAIIDRKPVIGDGAKTKNMDFEAGNITYNKVEFSYPTRPLIKVLQGLDLNVLYGKSVALVGSSGSGKSTCIQLLQRLYDPTSGSITVNGSDASSMPVSRLRGSLGIVSQEPTLFDRTISQNIAYGDNSREVPMAEIIEAARKANIHNFITTLPEGYDTRLGTKGAQLSGGQKQRIAIARALIRNPKILLLDEATSALDSQSEKVVQDALDEASSGRTCITIAHRLATIQNADLICVFEKGMVVESGTHSELMAKGGKYFELYQRSISH